MHHLSNYVTSLNDNKGKESLNANATHNACDVCGNVAGECEHVNAEIKKDCEKDNDIMENVEERIE